MRRTPPARTTPVAEAINTPCAQCPWRTANHGKRHPDGWYTKANRARLWAQLRRGEAMTCHPTDPENPVPLGARPVPSHVTTRECAGAIILQQREMDTLQRMDDFKAYRKARPMGLTREGVAEMISRIMFAGMPMIGGRPMPRPNLNEPVSHDPLGEWVAP